jgi:hypothetical protein
LLFLIHDENKNCNASAFSEIGRKISTAFEQFSDSAQRIGVYTADYADIHAKLMTWMEN